MQTVVCVFGIDVKYSVSCCQASLIGHMDHMQLLKSDTVFVEFGAGKGEFKYTTAYFF